LNNVHYTVPGSSRALKAAHFSKSRRVCMPSGFHSIWLLHLVQDFEWIVRVTYWTLLEMLLACNTRPQSIRYNETQNFCLDSLGIITQMWLVITTEISVGQLASLKKKKRKQTVLYCLQYCSFVGLAYQGKKDIVFRFIIEYSSLRFIIEYSSLRDLGPKVIIIIGLFLYEDYWKMMFLIKMCWNYLEGYWFLLEDFLKIIFLHGEIFEYS